MLEVSVAIATIPPRAKMLRRALASAALQSYPPSAIIVEYDHHRTGAAATKNRALAKVTTEWVAIVDDDDLLFPQHLEVCIAAQQVTGADVVYPWPLMNGDGARDPRPDRFGVPFDAAELRRGSYIPTTALFRTELAQRVGGFQKPPGSPYDDWGLWLAMLDAGATFHHVAERTWQWNVHGGNTSGLPVWQNAA
jgi:glycosyltransferase involved in cell wall biosynthesis